MNERGRTISIIILAFIFGLLFVFIIPPWQHYDEPKHFEYAWWVAHHSKSPTTQDFDQTMSRQVVESMIRHGFYKNLGEVPDLYPKDKPLRIEGYTQTDEPPVYYWIVSLPLRILGNLNIDAQLYATRFVSLLLYLVTILAGIGITREITSDDSPLRWMVPLSMALLPSFTDLMTAVNDDVGAVTVFTLFLWTSVRLLKHGFRWSEFLLSVSLVILGYFTKKTTLIAIPLLIIVVIYILLPRRWRKFAWIGLGIVALAGCTATFSWGDSAYWARYSFQSSASRVQTKDAPIGDSALRLDIRPGDSTKPPPRLQQLLPINAGKSLTGKTVTVAGWMWASRSMRARTPVFHTYTSNQDFYSIIDVTQKPMFFTFTASPQGSTSRAWINLEPLTTAVTSTVTFFYDGLILVEGSFPANEVPRFSDDRGTNGSWGGKDFINLIRNPSAESTWPRFYPWVDKIGMRVLPDYGSNIPSLALYTTLDAPSSGWYYRTTSEALFRSFWAKFGWGHVPLYGGRPYLILAVLTGLALLFAAVALVSSPTRPSTEILLVMLLALLGTWGFTLIRGSNYVLQSRPVFFPVARYAYPSIIPSLLVINLGWLKIAEYLGRRFRLPSRIGVFIFLGFWAVLDLYSIISIAIYYYWA